MAVNPAFKALFNVLDKNPREASSNKFPICKTELLDKLLF